MVCQNHNHELVPGFHKSETECQSSAALENVPFNLPNAQPAVNVRIAKGLAEIKQREHRCDSFRVGADAQLFLDRRG